MIAWLTLALVSALAGVVAAKLFRRPIAIAAAGATAWFGMLAFLLYNEYFVPYQGGGASLWPIAQLFGGTFAAIVAAGTAAGVASRQPRASGVRADGSGHAR